MLKFIFACAAAVSVSACTTASYVGRPDHSDKHFYRPTFEVIPVKRPEWKPGPRDTDGRPGEPGCPDCDGGGPYPPIHVERPRR